MASTYIQRQEVGECEHKGRIGDGAGGWEGKWSADGVARLVAGHAREATTPKEQHSDVGGVQ